MIQVRPLRAEGKYGLYLNEIQIYTFTNQKYIQALRYLDGQNETPTTFILNLKHIFQEYGEIFTNDRFKQMMKDCIHTQIVPPEIVSIPDPVTTLSLNNILAFFPSYRHKDMEILMSVMTQNKDTDCPAWLMLISPPSSGKSFALELFNHPNLSILVDDFTANALAPGRPNKDAAEVDSLFKIAAHKNFIISDLASIACMSKDKVQAFFGSITASYGLRFRKMSPGGFIDIETGFNLVMGVTPKTYRKHKNIMDVLGPRMLFMWYSPDPDGVTNFEKKIERTELQKHVSAFCLQKIKQENPVSISDYLKEYIYKETKKIVLIRNVRWSSEWRDMEGLTRLEKQLTNLAIAHAKLLNKTEVDLNDIDIFLPLAYETIPYENNILEIDKGATLTTNNKWTKAILEHAIEFKMVFEESVEYKKKHGFDKVEIEQITYRWLPEYDNIIFYLRKHKQNIVEDEEIEYYQDQIEEQPPEIFEGFTDFEE